MHCLPGQTWDLNIRNFTIAECSQDVRGRAGESYVDIKTVRDQGTCLLLAKTETVFLLRTLKNKRPSTLPKHT